MAVNPDFRDLFSELNTAEARFLVVGAHAVSYYSVPRYTKDLDILIGCDPVNAQRVMAALGRFGAPLDRLEVEDLSTPDTIFQIGVEPNRIDLLTSVDGVDFDAAWERRETTTYGEVPIAVLSLDDLIEAKRAAGRPQDRLDLSFLEKARHR
jgi:hypothetical protein